MRHRFALPAGMAGVMIVAGLFITCSRTLLDPTELELARGYAFLTDSLVASPPDTAGMRITDTISPGDTVYCAGLILPPLTGLRSRWHFDDGESLTGTSISYVFTLAGTYTPRFEISDEAGNTHADMVTVHVNSPPSIHGTHGGLINPPDKARHVDPGALPAFEWRVFDPDSGDTLLFDFYLGTSAETLTRRVSAIDSMSLVLDGPLSGSTTYHWFVVVRDRFGWTDTSEIYSFTTADTNPDTTHGITDHRPTGTVTTRTPRLSVRFTGTAVDPATAAIRFDGVDVTAEATVNSTGLSWTPSRPLADGVHTVRVSVGGASDTPIRSKQWSFTVDAMILEAGGDTTVTAGDTVHLRATVGNASSAVEAYRWDLDGDGEWDSTMETSDTIVSLRHVYEENGTYGVIVSAGDVEGTTKLDTVTVFVTSTAPVVQNISQDTTVSIGDSVFFTATARDLDGTIDEYAWDFDGDGTFDLIDAGSAAVAYRYDSAGTYRAGLRVTDNDGNTAVDSVGVRVVLDAPTITYLSADTIVDYGGTVRCSVAIEQAFGTVEVAIDTAGTGTFVPITDHETHATYRFGTTTASSWDSVKIRVTDDDGNRVTGGFAVDILPRKLTITRVDSSDSTIRIHYTKTLDSDFKEYRIYWDTTAQVDSSDNRRAVIGHAGTVSHSDDPSFESRPRYYRLYQLDEEGLWSSGSNVVFADITVTPPTTPTIVYPAADGDTVWANDVLRWQRSVSPPGTVHYRVLVKPDGGEYSVLADALSDTTLALAGYEHTDFTADIRVVASDNRTSSSAHRRDIVVRKTVDGRMRLIPAGTFVNGAGETVTIGRSFWMDTTEVTQKEFMDRVGGPNPSQFRGASRPVESVTWFEAIAYCNARSKAEGLDTIYSYSVISARGAANLTVHAERNGYRLPTEDEWEMAGRGGRGLLYPTDDGTIGNDKVNYRSLFTENVATYPPNPYGLYNMAGNVSEWCGDAFFTDRIARGGSWESRNPAQLRVTRRHPAAPSSREADIGFRCVRPAP